MATDKPQVPKVIFAEGAATILPSQRHVRSGWIGGPLGNSSALFEVLLDKTMGPLRADTEAGRAARAEDAEVMRDLATFAAGTPSASINVHTSTSLANAHLNTPLADVDAAAPFSQGEAALVDLSSMRPTAAEGKPELKVDDDTLDEYRLEGTAARGEYEGFKVSLVSDAPGADTNTTDTAEGAFAEADGAILFVGSELVRKAAEQSRHATEDRDGSKAGGQPRDRSELNAVGKARLEVPRLLREITNSPKTLASACKMHAGLEAKGRVTNAGRILAYRKLQDLQERIDRVDEECRLLIQAAKAETKFERVRSKLDDWAATVGTVVLRANSEARQAIMSVAVREIEDRFAEVIDEVLARVSQGSINEASTRTIKQKYGQVYSRLYQAAVAVREDCDRNKESRSSERLKRAVPGLHISGPYLARLFDDLRSRARSAVKCFEFDFDERKDLSGIIDAKLREKMSGAGEGEMRRARALLESEMNAGGREALDKMVTGLLTPIEGLEAVIIRELQEAELREDTTRVHTPNEVPNAQETLRQALGEIKSIKSERTAAVKDVGRTTRADGTGPTAEGTERSGEPPKADEADLWAKERITYVFQQGHDEQLVQDLAKCTLPFQPRWIVRKSEVVKASSLQEGEAEITLGGEGCYILRTLNGWTVRDGGVRIVVDFQNRLEIGVSGEFVDYLKGKGISDANIFTFLNAS